ncbi:MAG: proton-conducting membrane transporter [Planctomycetia bacterium]|nr:proton-conducting membrane transporter [Planctomycetia bacterium]
MPLFHFHDANLILPDGLAWVMAGLVVFIVANVTVYSQRYLAGDRRQARHQGTMLLLAVTTIIMVFSNHLLLLLTAWAVSNALLVKLMIHQPLWKAARQSGWLALKTFGVGLVLLGAGFWLLAEGAGTALISNLMQNQSELNTMSVAGLVLIALAALTQSAAWPFHRWLISSLNSPTPVSALMHAGLVNGGGFLLVRFASVYATQPMLLQFLFVAGLITAVLGTFWKLLQTDIKRMLACSTMGQMGFMLMQCGMGLFAPAISHLCWHGLFKAYLFLSAGSYIREQRSRARAAALTPAGILVAIIAGVVGAATFAIICGTPFSLADTRCLMLALAMMVTTQLAVGLLGERIHIIRVLGTMLACTLAGGLYGLSILLVDSALASLHRIAPQPMNVLYLSGLGMITLMWLAMLFDIPARVQQLRWWKKLYVAALNASQPHATTITATRTAYQY